jgi:hypothetical protein
MSQKSARDDVGTTEQRSRTRATGSGAYLVTKRPTRQAEQASVQEYLDRFATAMTSGNTQAMIQLWGVPAFVIGANEARVVQSEADVEQLFGGAKDLYNERGIVSTRAEITQLDWVSDDLVIATVRWPYLDETCRVLGEESSSYTLLRGEDGSFKVRVVTLRGQVEPIARAETGAPDDGTDGE